MPMWFNIFISGLDVTESTFSKPVEDTDLGMWLRLLRLAKSSYPGEKCRCLQGHSVARLSTRAQHTHTHTHTYICAHPAVPMNTDTLSPHISTGSTNGLVHFPSLAEEDLENRWGGPHDHCLHCLKRQLQSQGKKTFHHNVKQCNE